MMTADINADLLGDSIARAAHTGTDHPLTIVGARSFLKAVRDNVTVRGIVREWLERLEHPKYRDIKGDAPDGS